MNEKKSVMLSEHSVEIMRETLPAAARIPWSKSVNQAITVNDWLFRNSIPSLYESEWKRIASAYLMQDDYLSRYPFNIVRDVMEYEGEIDIEKTEDPDFMRYLHGLTQIELYAILSVVARHIAQDRSIDEIIG